MATKIPLDPLSMVTRQTVIDLTAWLSPMTFISDEQRKRLLNEQTQLALFYLANQFWLMGALVNKLQRHSVWQEFDDLTIEYLLQMEAFYAERADDIRQEIIDVCRLLSSQNIEIILLKGSASLFNRVSSPASIRFMSDIDILVPHDRQQQAVKILKGVGFEEDEVDHKIEAVGHYHATPLKRPEGVCYVEVHRAAQKTTLQDMLPTQGLWDRAMPLMLDDSLEVKQLSYEDQIVLSVVHSEIADYGYDEQQIELRQLMDFSNLCNRHHQHLDWQKIAARFEGAKREKPFYSQLYNANMLFGLDKHIPKAYQNTCQIQFEACIDNLVTPTQEDKRVLSVLKVIKGYSKDNMVNLYGRSDFKGVMKARLKHFLRHVKMTARIPDKKNTS